MVKVYLIHIRFDTLLCNPSWGCRKLVISTVQVTPPSSIISDRPYVSLSRRWVSSPWIRQCFNQPISILAQVYPCSVSSCDPLSSRLRCSFLAPSVSNIVNKVLSMSVVGFACNHKCGCRLLNWIVVHGWPTILGLRTRSMVVSVHYRGVGLSEERPIIGLSDLADGKLKLVRPSPLRKRLGPGLGLPLTFVYFCIFTHIYIRLVNIYGDTQRKSVVWSEGINTLLKRK